MSYTLSATIRTYQEEIAKQVVELSKYKPKEEIRGILEKASKTINVYAIDHSNSIQKYSKYLKHVRFLYLSCNKSETLCARCQDLQTDKHAVYITIPSTPIPNPESLFRSLSLPE